MNIEKLKKYEKCVQYNCIPLKHDHFEILLAQNKKNILKLSKMPYVLDLEKNYKNFSVLYKGKLHSSESVNDLENKEQKIENNNYKHILLVQKSEHYVEITYNYKFYTIAEILDIHNIPKIVSFQHIGHILHLNLREEHTLYKRLIGELYLDRFQHIKTVINKSCNINNTYRNIDYELLAGEDDLETIHIENKIRFYIDYRNVYWNSKLQSERKILLDSIKSNETIADVFCGAGPITIQAIMKGCKVYCNDLNPDAIKCIEKSVTLNNIERPTSYNLDAVDFLQRLIQENIKIDHFIMNLPETGLSYIKILQNYKSNFYIHNYFFCSDSEDLLSYTRQYCFFDVKDDNLRHIRAVSPNKNMYKLTVFVQNSK